MDGATGGPELPCAISRAKAESDNELESVAIVIRETEATVRFFEFMVYSSSLVILSSNSAQYIADQQDRPREGRKSFLFFAGKKRHALVNLDNCQAI